MFRLFFCFRSNEATSAAFGQKSSGLRENEVINNSPLVDGAALHTIKPDKMRLDYVGQAINKILKSFLSDHNRTASPADVCWREDEARSCFEGLKNCGKTRSTYVQSLHDNNFFPSRMETTNYSVTSSERQKTVIRIGNRNDSVGWA